MRAATAVPAVEPTMIRRPSIALTDKGATIGFAYRLSQALETLSESDAVNVMYLFVKMMPAHLQVGSSTTD